MCGILPDISQDIFQRLAKVLSNDCQECFQTIEKGLFSVWKRYYPTFERDIFQRLTKVLPNVWQRYCPILGKGIAQRLTKVLSRFCKSVKNISMSLTSIDIACLAFIWRWQTACLHGWPKCGRKCRCMISDHPSNRISYNVLCHICGRVVDFYNIACACIHVCVRTQTLYNSINPFGWTLVSADSSNPFTGWILFRWPDQQL